MTKDFYGKYIYNGKKGWTGFVVNSKDTVHYTDKEENDFGTWYKDISPSGACVIWFVEK